MRTSSYVIQVELPWSPDEVLLVHGYSGAFDVVPRAIAQHLRAHQPAAAPPRHGTWSAEEVPHDVALLPAEVADRLRLRGYLTELDVAAELERFRAIAQRLHQRAAGTRPTYVVMPTYACNLRCHYCFQDHMRTDPAYRHLLRVMTPEIYDRILTAFDHLDAKHGATGPRDVTLFGGEPLLAENRPLIEHIVRETHARHPTRISAISNATELHAYEDLLGPGGISWVQITLDGPPDHHDRRRVGADGSGSYERTVAGVDMCLRRGAEVSLRINVDRDNVETLPALVEDLIARGWIGRPGFVVTAEPVQDANQHVDPRSVFARPQLAERITAMTARYPALVHLRAPNATLRERLQRVLAGNVEPYAYYTAVHCSAQTDMFVFDPFADIYACWELTGDASIRVGHVDTEGRPVLRGGDTPAVVPRDDVPSRRRLPVVTSAPNRLESWRDRDVTTNPSCARCRYALFCGGGCAAHALEGNGNLHTSHCDGYQRTFRVSAADAYRRHLAGEAAQAAARSVCGA